MHEQHNNGTSLLKIILKYITQDIFLYCGVITESVVNGVSF